MDRATVEETLRVDFVAAERRADPSADAWASGRGVIEHRAETQARAFRLAHSLARRGERGDGQPCFDVLQAADALANAAMWLVVHETYADVVHLDGRDLAPGEFKASPEGHTGGALNMVPAYVGYLAANALTGVTRSWIMGQGHTVAAIDSVNLLVGNATDAHASRYALTDEGLTRYVRDFYSYRLDDRGRQESPLGSHVNVHTAGAMAEGGYLGFTELQYVHMPLPGERLVVFLSDGAFEEQRGSDWAPRWWRAEDCGLVAPIMIANGRRIDQRTTMFQEGEGTVDWFVDHLRLNGFDPIVFDGTDPAAFACVIIEMEERLEAAGRAARRTDYPVPLPYGVAVAPKGFGFHGAGTNLAHNLPLPGNPREDVESARLFNESARRLWVHRDDLESAVEHLRGHRASGRPLERDHGLARRDVSLREVPPLPVAEVAVDRGERATWTRASPMRALDAAFAGIVRANPHLRPRVGNPDEMRSNRLLQTLAALEFRVTHPEPAVPESIHGAVVTALNEEAVAAAALANKGGINLIATYEAFATKMHGVLRQEVTWAQQAVSAGRRPGWLSVPVVLTSHTWENSKNEQSHQDPSLAEVMLGEASHIARVVLVPDANTAAAALGGALGTHGQVWLMVVPKGDGVPSLFTPDEAARLVADGAARLDWAGHRAGDAELVLCASGGYQLEHTLVASARLAERDVAHSVVYLLEPGRFRRPRSGEEAAHLAPAALAAELFPADVAGRVFVAHTRPEPLLGTVHPLTTGPRTTEALGFVNEGGTLTVEGLLFRNRSSWAHVVDAATRVTGRTRDGLLTVDEVAALDGLASPEGVIVNRPAG